MHRILEKQIPHLNPVAAWMCRSDLDGSLAEFFNPNLSLSEREAARIEGWILGTK